MNESKYMYINLGWLEEYSQIYAALHAKEDYYCYCNLSQIQTKDGNDNNKLRTVKEAYSTALRKNSSKNFYDFPMERRRITHHCRDILSGCSRMTDNIRGQGVAVLCRFSSCLCRI